MSWTELPIKSDHIKLTIEGYRDVNELSRVKTQGSGSGKMTELFFWPEPQKIRFDSSFRLGSFRAELGRVGLIFVLIFFF